MVAEAVKKPLAHLFAGILLGTVITVLPWALNYSLSPHVPASGWVEFDSLECADADYQGLLGRTEPREIKINGSIGKFPSSLVYTGLLSAAGLVLALGVYSISKKRMRNLTSHKPRVNLIPNGA